MYISICLAKMRPDGFAGYTPQNKNAQATLSTVPIAYKEQAISINADIEEGGYIKTIVLDESRKEIATAELIKKTATNQVLLFHRKVKLDTISLKFEFKNAKIYAFGFGE
jgi:hypothetical protein